MTQGVYVNGQYPRTKQELVEAVKSAPDSVRLIATSLHGGEFDGPISRMPLEYPCYIVGPSPAQRKWYANIRRLRTGGFRVR